MTKELQHLAEGSRVQARVLGFLPGRKVVLEVDGEVSLAVSNVPLVRGMSIHAAVERRGGVLRLRILDEGAAVEDADLEACVAATARALGLEDDPGLFRSVCKRLTEALPDLQEGPVRWADVQPWVQDILEAEARGLPGTRRAWSAVRVGSEARLGTALARLRESIDVATLKSRGSRRREFADWSHRLGDFFVDLGSAAIVPLLQQAVRTCGYLGAPDETATASSDSGSDAADLRRALFELAAFLGEFTGLPLREHNIDFRRALEKSTVWCMQSLEILEGLQAQNAPADSQEAWSASLQIPVLDQGRPGTLFAILGQESSSLWLDVRGKPTIAAILRHDGQRHRVDLYLPAGLEAQDLDLEWGSRRHVELVVHEKECPEDLANVDLIV